MTTKFKHVLSPLQINGHLLKSRLIATPCAPSFVQQNEPYPTEGLIRHYANKAKGGAAIVHVSGSKIALEANMKPPALLHEFEFDYEGDINHYLSQLVEGIHDHSSLATIVEKHLFDNNTYDISGHVAGFSFSGTGGKALLGAQELTIDQLKKCTEELVERIYKLKEIGFDGVYLHMAYQAMLLGRSLSPVTNKRTDRYGGSFENRIRLATETCDAIKAACGKDFIIEACLTAEERDHVTDEPIPGGWTMEDTIRFTQAMEGRIDILHVRGWHIDNQQPLGFTPSEPPYLHLSEAIKKTNPNMKILALCGFRDPYLMDNVIAEGKADLIGMARAWISNPDFGDLVAEDREDEIVPCIRCNKCFRPSVDAPYTSRCSVNPRYGIEHRYKGIVDPAGSSRKVAIIGGGPAGMSAALTLKKRGHDVTVFEKTGELGGQLKIADHVSFKWPLRDFKNHLVNQMTKHGIEVRLNVEATREMVDEEGFEVAYLAMGSVPKPLDIPGADGPNVQYAVNVFGHENELAQDVVIIGGGETALDTGMHLAMKGHHATIVYRGDVIAKEMSTLHYRSIVMNEASKLDQLDIVLNATPLSIDAEGVTYLDAEGNTQKILAGSVVISVGNTALQEDAIKFSACNARTFIIGDNRNPGSVMDLTRDAYFAAMKI